jgi:hypothetical protein
MIDAIIDEIKKLPFDYKAEAVAGQLLNSWLPERQLLVRMENGSRRPFTRDINGVEKVELKNYQEALQLTITRSALFDLLPEGLFFQSPGQSARKLTAAEMAEASREIQKQEKKIRNFFSPLEQEFFYHRYLSYQVESDLLDKLEEGLLHEYLVNFWKLHKQIPKKMAVRLVLLMPFIHQIAGSEALMASALNAIIQVPVTCTLVHNWQQATGALTSILGKVHLGDSSTCGTNFEDEDYVFDFSIHLTEGKDISEYLEGGNLYHLLQAFYQYFVPANAGYQATLVFQNKQREWHLGKENPHHLGISSFI